MARLILHVGPPKTATTYIQETLADNRTTLQRVGIEYPTEWAGGARLEHHHQFMWDMRAAFGDTPDAAQPALQPEFDTWLAMVGASNQQAFVLSSEGFGTVKPHAWAAFDALAKSHGIDIEIAVALRSAERWIVSAWSQQLKLGATATLPAFLQQSAAARHDFPRWGELFARFSPAVPNEQLHIVVLDELQTDVMSWLCNDVLGIDDNLERAPVGRDNRGFSTAASETLRVATIVHQEQYPDDPPDALWARFNTAYYTGDRRLAAVVRRVEEQLDRSPLVPVNWFAAVCRPDHDQVLANFGDRIRRDHDSDGLFPDVSSDEFDGAIPYADCADDRKVRADVARLHRHLCKPSRRRRRT